MQENVVVRFAPSPTGYLHVGGARTAIFNWLYARKTGGKFILRIEDTDADRSSEDLIQGILDSLAWLGLNWDQGPDFQSKNIEAHLKAAQSLLKSGHAYHCFCTKEELDKKRELAQKNKHTYKYDGACRCLSPEQIAEKKAAGLPYTIRLKVPHTPGAVQVNDAVYGQIEKKYQDIEDFVIVRSNGQPLYMLCNAVDDIRDGVTHIIRGQDGLANTPKQILIYQALNARIPVFAHMSLALDPKKAKISKRKHGEKVAVHYYKDMGFLPWALVNFLVLLGWSTSNSQEIFSQDELIQKFSLEGISKNNPVFDIRQNDAKFFTDPKAININAHYLRNLPIEDIAPYVKEQLKIAGIWNLNFDGKDRERFFKIVDIIRARFHVTTDFATLGRAYFSDDFIIDPKILKKNLLKHDILKIMLPAIAERINVLEKFTRETIEPVLKNALAEFKVKPGLLMNAMRVVLTGQSVGPEFFEVLLILGKETVSQRLKLSKNLF